MTTLNTYFVALDLINALTHTVLGPGDMTLVDLEFFRRGDLGNPSEH